MRHLVPHVDNAPSMDLLTRWAQSDNPWDCPYRFWDCRKPHTWILLWSHESDCTHRADVVGYWTPDADKYHLL